MEIVFTKTEREMILHRLEVPDALADCLTAELEDNTETPEFERLHDIAYAMWAELNSGNVLTINTKDQRDILADCADGSTWFCALSIFNDGSSCDINMGEITPQHYGRLVSVAEKLEDRLLGLGVPVTNGFDTANDYFM